MRSTEDHVRALKVWLIAVSLLCVTAASFGQSGNTHEAKEAKAKATTAGEPAAAASTVLAQQPVVIQAAADKQMILAATAAGRRVVAVGDRGVVLLSDDEGKSFRQAKSVPTRATLNSVSFVDEKNGWAAGHWGVILHTSDGGEHWVLQRSDTSVDRPLFAVLFADAEHGWAAGLWSLLLATHDGGKTWTEAKLPPPPGGGKADRNLLALFSSKNGSVFIAAERGTVLRSDDQGARWSYLETGYQGSFWSGCALDDGVLLVAGLRGTIYRSTDDGKTWVQAKSEAKSSITGIRAVGDKVIAVALDGITLESSDRGASFSSKQRDDRLPLTTLTSLPDKTVLMFSKSGVVP